MSSRLTKALAVVFLTLLIWTWAFLSQEKQTSFWGTLETAQTVGDEYWVHFSGNQSSFPIKLNLRGSPSKMADLERLYRAEQTAQRPQPLVFYYNPQVFGHTRSGVYTLDVQDLVRTSPTFQTLALTLVSCEPPRLDVRVEVLVQKALVVQCVDEAGLPLKAADVKPSQVTMYVRADYTGPALVTLSNQQIEAARRAPIRQKPYVNLAAGGPRRIAADEVEISLPATEQLNEYPFQPQQIGFIFSRNTQGKYRVQIENESDLRTVQIRATPEALEAYRRMRYPLLIEIRDEDATASEIPPREVIFNFPAEFVRRGQIEAAAPRTATIKLVPLQPTP